jgi:hypothetical protein
MAFNYSDEDWFDPPPSRPDVVPTDYEYLRSGDAALTRAVKKVMGRNRVYVVRKKVSKFYPPRAVGIWALPSVIAAERERLAALRTVDRKAKIAQQRKKRQERDANVFCQAIMKRFPGCPAQEAASIAAHACEIGSGRVGRSSTADDPVRAAVIAHIRHQHTNYEELVSMYCAGEFDRRMREESRQYARYLVEDKINEVLRLWEPPNAVCVDTPKEDSKNEPMGNSHQPA